MQTLNLFYEIIRDYLGNRHCDLDLCGGSDDNQKVTPIRCHKLVMCSLIPNWQEIVSEETDRIHLPDVEHSDLQGLVDGLYAQLAMKQDSWEHFDPALLAFLRIGPKVGQGSKQSKTQTLPFVTEGLLGEGDFVTFGGIKIEFEDNSEADTTIWQSDPLNPKHEPSHTPDIDECMKDKDLTVGQFDFSEKKRKPNTKPKAQASKKIKFNLDATLSTKLIPPETSSNLSNHHERLFALEDNRSKIENTKQTNTIEFESVRNQLQENAPGSLHVDFTTSNLQPHLKNLSTKSLTSQAEAFFALVGIQRFGSEILGRTLAYTTQDVEAIHASFLPTIEAYMKVFGFAQVPLMSANCFYTHTGLVKKGRTKHFINDLHRRFLYKSTRKDLENELNQPDVVQGFSKSPPTCKDVPLPIVNYDIHLTQDHLNYEDIIILGVHKHGVEARQFEIHDISEDYVAHFCSRILTLIWVGGNGQAIFPPCNEIMLTNRVNIRLNYTFKTIKKLLASDESLPRSLPIVTCEICGKQIQENAFMNNLIVHKRIHIIQQFKCDCDVKFTSLTQKKKHYEEWHSGKKSVTLDNKKAHEISRVPKQTLVCHLCGKVVPSLVNLWQHNRRCHQNITCQACNKKFNTAMAYKRHLKHEHPGQEVDTPEGWLRCSECDEIFSERVDLSKHWNQLHASEEMRPYKCGVCHKSYIEKPKLKAHALSAHIKSRPFKCREKGCSSAFNYIGNLYAHEKKLHGANLGPTIPLDTVVKDSQLLEMGCQLKSPSVPKYID